VPGRPPAFADTAVGGRDPNPTNPHRNGNGASTSNNGHYVGEFICAADCPSRVGRGLLSIVGDESGDATEMRKACSSGTEENWPLKPGRSS
jgi:hypothetical protein